jgi:hypothetical protein
MDRHSPDCTTDLAGFLQDDGTHEQVASATLGFNPLVAFLFSFYEPKSVLCIHDTI